MNFLFQLNFMVDLSYVGEVYRACKCGNQPLLVMYGQLDMGNMRIHCYEHIYRKHNLDKISKLLPYMKI